MPVTVLDSLTRPGVEENLRSLKRKHGDLIRVEVGDIRDVFAVRRAMASCTRVFHLAAQVAVTTSLERPRDDLGVNVQGTINVLEEARRLQTPPAIVFTSTNKVYGDLAALELALGDHGYEPLDELTRARGISERQSLEFSSPYGCSKGAADQYVRDYARIYGLPTVVFRMSCIYGPRQFGTEDQGWVAHFIISALTGRPITIYGNGKQVRDVLFVDDLVRAFRLAVDKIDKTVGEVFNIGGGPSNTMSVWAEFGQLVTELSGRNISVNFDDWRPGDQPCYVSCIQKASELLEWRPLIDKETGVRRLWEWASSNLEILERRRLAS
jgi:CDP-paratose 2-epimerase